MKGAKTADMVAIILFNIEPLLSPLSLLVDCWSPVNASKCLNTSPTLLPITTWNCPLFSTTVTTPSISDTFLLEPEIDLFNTKRNLVAQCVLLTIFSSPPTASNISWASFWFLSATVFNSLISIYVNALVNYNYTGIICKVPYKTNVQFIYVVFML